MEPKGQKEGEAGWLVESIPSRPIVSNLSLDKIILKKHLLPSALCKVLWEASGTQGQVPKHRQIRVSVLWWQLG